MTQKPSTPRATARRAPWGAASWVVALSLVTSAAAHVEAGGLLPGPAGSALLLLVMGLLWLVASRTTRTRAGLLANFALGQALCHLAYSVGTMQAPTFIVEADGTRHWGDPMAGAPMAHAVAGHSMAGHTMGSMAATGSLSMGDMAGMHHGSHPALMMLLAHGAAVVVSTALVLVLRRLPAAARRWLLRLAPTPPRQLVTVLAILTHVEVPGHSPLWAHAPPPPRRGPPVLA